jgi:hypothetical protein
MVQVFIKAKIIHIKVLGKMGRCMALGKVNGKINMVLLLLNILGNIVMVLNKGLENILIVKVLLIKQLG